MNARLGHFDPFVRGLEACLDCIALPASQSGPSETPAKITRPGQSKVRLGTAQRLCQPSDVAFW